MPTAIRFVGLVVGATLLLLSAVGFTAADPQPLFGQTPESAPAPPPAESDPPQEAAPATPLRGRIVYNGQPTGGVPVQLHQITPEASGQVASAVSGENGEFQFSLEVAQGAAFTLYFTTADFSGVRYFGPVARPGEPVSEYTLAVFDTTSVLSQPLRVSRRDVIYVPEADGAWEVNEIIRIVNPTTHSLLPRDAGASWEVRIPSFAASFEAGDPGIAGCLPPCTGIFPHQVTQVEDRILVLGPLIPGEQTLVFRYLLPAGRSGTTLRLDEPTDSLTLFVAQPSPMTEVAGLQPIGFVDSEGERFMQYGAVNLPRGTELDLTWDPGDIPPVNPILAAIIATILLLAVGVWAGLRNRLPSLPL